MTSAQKSFIGYQDWFNPFVPVDCSLYCKNVIPHQTVWIKVRVVSFSIIIIFFIWGGGGIRMCNYNHCIMRSKSILKAKQKKKNTRAKNRSIIRLSFCNYRSWCGTLLKQYGWWWIYLILVSFVSFIRLGKRTSE